MQRVAVVAGGGSPPPADTPELEDLARWLAASHGTNSTFTMYFITFPTPPRPHRRRAAAASPSQATPQEASPQPGSTTPIYHGYLRALY